MYCIVIHNVVLHCTVSCSAMAHRAPYHFFVFQYICNNLSLRPSPVLAYVSSSLFHRFCVACRPQPVPLLPGRNGVHRDSLSRELHCECRWPLLQQHLCGLDTWSAIQCCTVPSYAVLCAVFCGDVLCCSAHCTVSCGATLYL